MRARARAMRGCDLSAVNGYGFDNGIPSSQTVGSRSTYTARGTCLPAPVSEKKVLKASSPPPIYRQENKEMHNMACTTIVHKGKKKKLAVGKWQADDGRRMY